MNGSNDQDDEDTRFSDLKKNFTVSAGFRRENEEMEGDPDVVGLKRGVQTTKLANITRWTEHLELFDV